MDRRFFREAYNAELILTDLGNSVAGIRDIKHAFADCRAPHLCFAACGSHCRAAG